VLKLKSKPNIHFVRGRIAHTTLEKFFKLQIYAKSGHNYSDVKKGLLDLFERLRQQGIIEKCNCGLSIRNGYQNECSICHGASYRNTQPLNDILGSGQ